MGKQVLFIIIQKQREYRVFYLIIKKFDKKKKNAYTHCTKIWGLAWSILGIITALVP